MANQRHTDRQESLRCLQINTGRSRDSHDLIEVKAREEDIDILVISEPNKTLAKYHQWLTDQNIDAALIIRTNKVKAKNTGRGKGFAWMELENMVLYSCYVSPNIDITSYEAFLEDLADDIRRKRKKVVLGGDFNAKSYLWAARIEDRRGTILTEWMAQLRLEIVNHGNKPTFQRNCQESIIDLTICSEGDIAKFRRWEVSEDETLSWHKAIYFDIALDRRREGNVQNKWKPTGWKICKENYPRFECLLEKYVQEGKDKNTRSCVRNLTSAIVRACNGAFKKRRRTKNKKPVYWWTDNIEEKRKECLKAKRRLTRINKRGDENQKEEHWQEYKLARTKLRKEIKIAKAEAWKKTIDDLDQDIFGQGYRIVTNKLRKKVEIEETTQMEIARSLFPQLPMEELGRKKAFERPAHFEEDELMEAAANLKTGKAAGLDNIPPEIAKIAAFKHKDVFLEIANHIIDKGTYPTEWKTAKLILVEKPRKTASDAPTYRPICLLDTAGKIVEAMLVRRINQELENLSGLSEKQFGFRKGRSTIDAMEEVIACLERGTRKRNNRGYCVLITLDIRNAFNSAKWTKIIRSMEDKGISTYLVETVKSYLQKRTVRVGSSNILQMRCGVPQGSKLGPLLWNIMYDGIFNIDMPEGATTIGFADDIAIVITAWTTEELQLKAEVSVELVTKWLENAGLAIAPQKTEAVLLAGRRSLTTMSIRVQRTEVQTSQCLKYLGVHFDKDLRMKQHIIETAKKAGEAVRKLSRLMPNTCGPTTSRRKVLNSVVNSIILYAAPVWYKAIEMNKYKYMLLQVQRQMSIRISSAYRTVSTLAAQVLAGTIPIDLLITERQKLRKTGKEEMVNIRKGTMETWQERWEVATEGAWTRKLIPKVEPWINRKHGAMDFHLTQILAGHGCFEHYLHKINRRQSGTCKYCQEEEDTAEHTLLRCARWTRRRRKTEEELGEDINVANLTTLMLKGEKEWNAIKRLANDIMRTKENDERDQEEERRRRHRETDHNDGGQQREDDD